MTKSFKRERFVLDNKSNTTSLQIGILVARHSHYGRAEVTITLSGQHEGEE